MLAVSRSITLADLSGRAGDRPATRRTITGGRKKESGEEKAGRGCEEAGAERASA